MLNVISIDVEEYFHAANLAAAAGPAYKNNLISRAEASTETLLEILDEQKVQGTFFFLGQLARRFPQLVKRTAEAGHEIASHGYWHKLVYHQTPPQFFRDVYRAKSILEDISGKAVHGYRAPSFSIRKEQWWAYDRLIQAGYRYDSSCYPIWHPRYANSERSTKPEEILRPEGKLYEFPLAVSALQLCGRELRLPLAGGAYWRLFPKAYLIWGLRRLEQSAPGWFSCYVHPWEFDPAQPIVPGLSFLTRLRHYGRMRTFGEKFAALLRSFRFGSFAEAGKQSFGPHFLDAGR